MATQKDILESVKSRMRRLNKAVASYKESLGAFEDDHHYRRLLELETEMLNESYLLVEMPEDLSTSIDNVCLNLALVEQKRRKRMAEKKQPVDSSTTVFAKPPPLADLPVFRGDPCHFSRFWAVFKSRVWNANLDPPIKLDYLINVMKDEKTKKILEGFDIDTYKPKEVEKVLMDRYTRPSVKLTDLMEKVANLPKIDSEKAKLDDLEMFHEALSQIHTHKEELGEKGVAQLMAIIVSNKKISSADLEKLLPKDSDEINAYDINVDDLYNMINRKVKIERQTESNKSTDVTPKREPKFNIKPKVRINANSVQYYKPIPRIQSVSNEESNTSCLICEGEHRVKDCTLTVSERITHLRRQRRCLHCLNKDESNHRCLYIKWQCKACRPQQFHHYLLCKDRFDPKGDSPPVAVNNHRTSSNQTSVKSVISYCNKIEQAIAGPGFVPIGVINLEWKNRSVKAIAFYDRGTSHTLISTQVAESLELDCQPIRPKVIETIAGRTPPFIKTCTNVIVSAPNGTFRDEWTVYVSSRMPPLETPNVTQYKHLLPADMEMCQSGEIKPHIIIGAWHTIDITITPATPVIKITSDIMIEKNLLGWAVLGRDRRRISSQPCSHFNTTREAPCGCQLIEKVFDDPLACKNQADLIQDQYIAQFSQLIRYEKSEKRFYVRFSWINDERPPNNFQEALATTWRIFKSFNPPELLERYQNELDTLVKSGYAQRIANNATSGYFIPHRPVVKEGSTTSVRPVFNGSFSRKGKKSLNDLLFQGAWKMTNLLDPVLYWRTHRFAIFVDLEKAFLQIRLEHQERKYAKFLWFKKSNNSNSRPELYQMTSVLFGATSSPFLLYAVMRKLFQEHAPDYLKNFTDMLYMDDSLLVATDLEELKRKFKDVKRVLAIGSFKMHKFACSPEVGEALLPIELRSTSTNVKVLGLMWDKLEDEILWKEIVSAAMLKEVSHGKITRRQVASVIGKLFDPLGLLAPFTVKCRQVLRASFTSDGWDDPLPEEQLTPVIQLLRELHHLPDVKFPRVCIENPNNMIIDIYTDGSSLAYSAAVYLSKAPNTPSNLLCARTRLAPKEKRSVSQLELCGAVLGVQLGNTLKSLFKCPVRYFARTDTTIERIRAGPHHREAFEAHRITIIRKDTNPEDWHYIHKKENPANLAANGRTLSDLRSNQIWRNPISPDLTSPRVHAMRIHRGDTMDEEKAISKFLKAPYSRIKTFAELFFELIDRRYQYFDRLQNGQSVGSQAFISIWKLAQRTQLKTTFERLRTGKDSEDEPRYLRKKSLFIDQHGLLRVDSRLEEADIRYEQRFRLVLPSSDLTSSFLKHLHSTSLRHSMTPNALVRLRQVYLIPDAEQRMRPIVDACLRCNRYRAPPCETPMAPLPRDRVVSTHAFDVVGIDIFGQLRPTPRKTRRLRKTKEKEEAEKIEDIEEAFYVLIFVCAQSRAIHLEPILSKSTTSIKNAMSRFCSLYGTPTKFISDNEKSFKQMSKWLRSIRPQVEKAFAQFRKLQPVQWQFIPPRSPWFGGFYERLIQLVKRTLRSYEASRFGSVDELYTILAEVQCMVNSRPLVRMPGELDYLTPYHLIYGHGIQPLSFVIEAADPQMLSLIAGQKSIETKLNLLWKKWKESYLPAIRAYRSAPSRVPQVSELVILNEPTRYRSSWPLGVVQDIQCDRHGVPHRATIKKLDGTVLTNVAIKRLYRAEGHEAEEDSSPTLGRQFVAQCNAANAPPSI